MAVAQVVQFQIVPGRNPEFMTNVAAGKKIHERLGGRVRVWAATAAGPNTGTVSYVIEHDDLAAFASFSDKLAADSEWQEFLAKTLQRADPAGTLLGASLVNELPL